ncbi:hypothetical protein R3P38DRAFT_2823697 [Favolaschia claudopus]|uniref:Uncharacterized protein n=1 Tax=Favolaschia claudopus TaxID=2862362 RepID=A0AAW0EIF7_9AGAR
MFVTKPLVLALSLVAVNAAPQLDSIFDTITSDIASVGTQIAGGAEGVFETVTSVGGHAVTVFTSEGGQAWTVATDGVGKAMTFGGSVFTVATGEAGAVATENSAPHSMSMPSTALTVGILTIFTSACLGAMITV